MRELNNDTIYRSDYIKKSKQRIDKFKIKANIDYESVSMVNQMFSIGELRYYFNNVISDTILDNYLVNIEASQCNIFMYDPNGKYLACLYNNNNYEITKIPVRFIESEVGTNAVSCALQEETACQVIGREHTNKKFWDIVGYAVPYKNNNKIAGVIYIITKSDKINENIVKMSKKLVEFFQKNKLSNLLIYQSQTYLNILESMTVHTNRGFLYIDQFKVVQGYNKKILKILDVEDNKIDFKNEIFEKINYIGAYSDSDFQNKTVFLKTRKNNKSYLASNKRVYLLDQHVGTSITLVDTEEISKLNNKIKGNRATYVFDDIICQSKKMIELKALAKKVSKTSTHILINGESGTGKEVLAQSIHNESLRNNSPFIAINCGAMPLELMESELFGYEAGSFTGALKSGKIGKLEFASGGTLFLDEIESMPLTLQIKLLRVLSTKTITRLGSIDEIPIDIRIIAATKKDLLEESKLGNFREDLYYRINVIEIKIPALRDRKEDIPILVNHMIYNNFSSLIKNKVKLSTTFLDALMTYSWPGNVRELSNVIERCMILKEDEELSVEHLTDDIVDGFVISNVNNYKVETSNDDESLYKKFERLFLNKILEEEDGNVTLAAKRLGLSRQTLYRKLKWIK